MSKHFHHLPRRCDLGQVPASLAVACASMLLAAPTPSMALTIQTPTTGAVLLLLLPQCIKVYDHTDSYTPALTTKPPMP